MLSLSLLLLIGGGAIVKADRQISIENRCDYTVWPAVSGTFKNSGYAGPRGWEAAPKSAPVVVTIPEGWNGRGLVAAATSMPMALAPALRETVRRVEIVLTIRWEMHANLLEMNLNQGVYKEDFYDIPAVPGFITPISVSLSDPSCHAVTCSTDLNPTCPEPLRIMDGSNIIGCLSACMAKINAGPNSANCCSGSFLSHEACQPQMIDYYDFFKQGCPEAYAYPRDERPNDPSAVKVVYTCPAAGSPSYTVVFCPDAVGTVGNVKVSASNVTMTNNGEKSIASSASSLYSPATGLSKTALISLIVVAIVLLLIAAWLFFLVARLHKQEKAVQQQADEAQMALALSSRSMGKKGSRREYRDESSEGEQEVKRSGWRRSRA